MSRMFEIIMVGIISGIVAITTSILGIAGTIIGSVIGSMLFQIMSTYLKDPIEDINVREIENKLAFLFPLIIIFIIELIYLIYILKWDYMGLFLYLEGVTGWMLFRIIGLALIFMGLYSFLISKHINKTLSGTLSFIGLLVFLRGLIDTKLSNFVLYYLIFNNELFDLLLTLCVLIFLLFIIFNVLKDVKNLLIAHKPDSFKYSTGFKDIYMNKNHDNIENENLDDIDDFIVKLDEKGNIKSYSDEYSTSESIKSTYKHDKRKK